MRHAYTFVTVVVLWGATFASCGGGGSDPGPSSGLTRSEALATLDANETGILCDWSNAKQGGYGRNVSCPDGPGTTDRSKESCVSGIPLYASLCPTLTVGDVEDCDNAIGTDLCAFYTAAACANVRACVNG
jgi:hypothetical protein